MDPKRLLTVMAQRLYEDMKFVTEQNPTQIVDDDGARAYNVLLARTKKLHAHVENVNDFTEWSPRTIKYKDALVVAGQLSAMLEALTASDTRVASRVAPSGPGPGMPTLHTPLPASAPPRPQVPQVPVAPKTPSNPLDVELYGAVNPPKRNDDGTIPFSLD